MNLSRWAIKHSRITIAFWVAIAIGGLVALSSLQYNLFPDVTFPVIVVRGEVQTSTVEEAERQVTIPLESALQDLSDLTDIESTTYPRQVVMSLLLEPGLELDLAETEVKTVLEKIDFSTPPKLEVIPLNLNESTAVSYAMTSDSLSLAELTQVAENLVIPELKILPGVGNIELLGDKKDNNTLVRFNGSNAIALRVVKTAEGNTLAIVKQVARTIAKLRSQLPDMELTVAETQAQYIEEATQATIEALLGAIAISVLTILAFLRSWRATAIAAIAIPISLLGTFIFMAIAGFNLETLTLLALALTIGIIVDDAIVEVENIVRHLEEGKSATKAALLATKEIGFTVSVSTLTIVAVFLPIALMGGTLGKFFRPFGLTISVAVLTSLLVARTLAPVLAMFWLQTGQIKKDERQDRDRGLQNLVWYRNVLNWALSHRKTVIAIAISISIAGIALIPLIPQGFIPDLDRGEFNVFYRTPLPQIELNKPKPPTETTDSSFSWLSKIARNPEAILLRHNLKVGQEIASKLLNLPDIESTYTIAGYRGQPNRGKIYIKLKSERNLSTNEAKEKVRQTLSQIIDATIAIEDIPFVETGSDKPFQIALEGDNLAKLAATAIAIKEKISSLPSLVDVSYTGENEDIPVITHLNQQRVVYLTGNLTPGSAIGDVTSSVIAIAEPLLPPEIKLNTQGDSARAGKILGEFAITLTLAVLLMLGVLYLPFKRWLEPLVIGLSLPLAIIGAMFALLVTQSDFGMISLMGLIFLLGLLDKNGILLMDYANQLRRLGFSRRQALVDTGLVRFRPIIMTTASTILGMLPIALGWGAGAELRQPMAVAIIGGLAASSVLSLIVIPVLYSFLDEKI